MIKQGIHRLISLVVRHSKPVSLFFIFLMTVPVWAQEKTVRQHQQVWFGYINTLVINNKFSLWNDLHYVPKGFFVARTGVTRQLESVGITAGYGFLLLPKSASDMHLVRKEHRPWAQLIYSTPLSKSVTFVNRIRYDARFKQDVFNGELQPTYGFYNRVRFLAGLRVNLPFASTPKSVPFLAVFDEVLLNFGKEITANTFDQNRIQVSLGVQRGKIQYQIGYMNRLVQTGNTQYVSNHTLLLWVIHKLKLRKAVEARTTVANTLED